MAYTALQLITRALYLSQIVSRDLQTPSNSQIEDGLYLLNAIIDFKNTDLRLIPYFKEYEFTATANQELYTIPNLLFIDTMTFNLGTVRYMMKDLSRYEYFGVPRVDNISSLPFSFRQERQKDGMNVYIYFLPQQNYLMKIWGKFGLTEVNLTTDLSQVYDLYYIEYLRHELAQYLCNEFAITFPDGAERKYQEIRKKLLDVSPADLSLRKSNYFNRGVVIDWQTINLTQGYYPS